MSQRFCGMLSDTDYEELQKLASELDIEVSELVKRLVLYGLYHVDELDEVMNDFKRYRWHHH